MKIHHYVEKGNNSLTKINKNQPRFLLSGGKTSCRLCGNEFISDGKSYESSLKSLGLPPFTNDNKLTISSYDLLGFSKDFDIVVGDVVIIGSNVQDLEHLSTEITSAFQKNNIPLEEYSPVLYTVEKLKRPKEQSAKYKLVVINANKTVPELIKFILKSCRTKIVFGLDELKILCGLHGAYKDTGLVNNIVLSLGGDFDIRKRFISSLDHGEFLVSKGDKEEIRSLKESLVN